ncbi:MAG TPA: hypothetical protein DCZ71_01945 [Ruminococcus sp.]|nr:hypothetical protein [Ruminococcus sp.]
MNTILGSIRHRVSVSNTTHLIWCGAIILIMLILAFLHHRWKGDDKKIRLWRFLCLVPLLIAGVHALIYVYGFPLFVTGFVPMYAIAVSALLPVPFAKRRIGYGISAALTGILTSICGFFFLGLSPDYFNHTRESYTDSFHSMVQDMDSYYILKEWKEVDLAGLEAKYMPMVQEAEQANDPAKFEDAVTLFCNELHDGHVSIQRQYDKEKYKSAFAPHEYGLAMIKLDNGDVIAVCTTDEVNKLGIVDGTVITKWNGKPVGQAAEEDVMDPGLPVKANAERIAAIYLSGMGGETVEASFLDESGKEKTVTLSDLGEPHTQMEALKAFTNCPEFGEEDEYDSLNKENFSTKMLNDKCGYLRLTAEGTDNVLYDILVGYLTGDHRQAREMFRKKLRDLKAQGMEYLVVDLRNNMGGMDEVGCALCDLLTDQDWYCQGLGIRKNGEYKCVSDHGIHGDGEFADLPVVAITNFTCISAGDGVSLYISKLPNVTLAGITDPNGCNQETGGFSALSDGLIYVGFPVGLILDENGVPNIDTGADLISRDPVEKYIPLDYDAAMKIFRDKEDYELDWAVRYLEEYSK